MVAIGLIRRFVLAILASFPVIHDHGHIGYKGPFEIVS
jgi:hypothetical protein